MFLCNQGYAFEGRIDCNGRKGIKESLNIFGGIATIVCGLRANGKISPPVYYTASDGFRYLEDEFKTQSDIDTFLRSNRGTYAIIGHSSYMVKVKINVTTKDILSIDVFMPTHDLLIDGKTPGTAYAKLSTESGLHKTKVGKEGYNALLSEVANSVKRLDLSSKGNYLYSRYLVGGNNG